MSKNTSNVTFQYRNEIIEVSTPTLGVVFVVAKTPRGPIADPSTLIANPGQLEMYFGKSTTEYPHMEYIKDLLTEGGKVRISRILGSGASAAKGTFIEGSTPWFELSAKYLGKYGNAIEVTVGAATDGNSDHFNLTIKDTTDSAYKSTELYENIDPTNEVGTAGPYTYLDRVITLSERGLQGYLCRFQCSRSSYR